MKLGVIRGNTNILSYDIPKRIAVRERAGYYCQVCGEWIPPVRGKKTVLDAHSTTHDHKDEGITACSSQRRDGCHTRLHLVAKDDEDLRKISLGAVELNNLSMAVRMVAQGVPERRIRRVLARTGSF